MARNHVNYAIGRYSIEPMGMSGTEKTCTIFTGTLCEVKEKLTYKKSGFYHWLSLGFDGDSHGPTKQIFFNVLKDKEIIWLFQMTKNGLLFQEGDEVTIEYSGKAITVIVNGEEVPKVKASKTSALYKELYRCRRINSINIVLRKVCSWALPADVRDEVEGESVYRCRELLTNMLIDARESDLRLLIGKIFFPEAVLLNFKEMHEELRKMMSKKSLIEILYSQEEFIESEESDSEGKAIDSEYESGVDTDNEKDTHDEFEINDFTN